jgi:hypothetical protein
MASSENTTDFFVLGSLVAETVDGTGDSGMDTGEFNILGFNSFRDPMVSGQMASVLFLSTFKSTTIAFSSNLLLADTKRKLEFVTTFPLSRPPDPYDPLLEVRSKLRQR